MILTNKLLIVFLPQDNPIAEKPTPFTITDTNNEQLSCNNIDEDYFFRPWKMEQKICDLIKVNAFEDINLKQLCLNNKEFLEKLFSLAGAKKEYVDNNMKALWSCTHLYALLDCEKFWNNYSGNSAEKDIKNNLTNKIPVDMRDKLLELACTVWERRFIHSGFEVQMGAHLCLEILQVNSEWQVYMYSFMYIAPCLYL